MSARILIIEDNETNLKLMMYLVRAFGHTPLTARDGVEGIEAVCREMPDLILCDLNMPKMDGFEVAAALKADPALSAIPIIAVTASAMISDYDKALAAGFDGYIPKPINPETFIKQAEIYL